VKRWLVVIVVGLAACAAPAEDVAAPSSPAGSTAAPAPGVPAALAWSADLVEGGQLDGADLAGGDVALWFWAPW
jgi:hypothetical protein